MRRIRKRSSLNPTERRPEKRHGLSSTSSRPGGGRGGCHGVESRQGGRHSMASLVRCRTTAPGYQIFVLRKPKYIFFHQLILVALDLFGSHGEWWPPPQSTDPTFAAILSHFLWLGLGKPPEKNGFIWVNWPQLVNPTTHPPKDFWPKSAIKRAIYKSLGPPDPIYPHMVQL